MASDGGVQAKLEAAKSALSSANKFEKSAGGPVSAPASKPSYTQAHAARKAPTVGDELAAKKANVEEYTKQYGNQ